MTLTPLCGDGDRFTAKRTANGEVIAQARGSLTLRGAQVFRKGLPSESYLKTHEYCRSQRMANGEVVALPVLLTGVKKTKQLSTMRAPHGEACATYDSMDTKWFMIDAHSSLCRIDPTYGVYNARDIVFIIPLYGALQSVWWPETKGKARLVSQWARGYYPEYNAATRRWENTTWELDVDDFHTYPFTLWDGRDEKAGYHRERFEIEDPGIGGAFVRVPADKGGSWGMAVGVDIHLNDEGGDVPVKKVVAGVSVKMGEPYLYAGQTFYKNTHNVLQVYKMNSLGSWTKIGGPYELCYYNTDSSSYEGRYFGNFRGVWVYGNDYYWMLGKYDSAPTIDPFYGIADRYILYKNGNVLFDMPYGAAYDQADILSYYARTSERFGSDIWIIDDVMDQADIKDYYKKTKILRFDLKNGGAKTEYIMADFLPDDIAEIGTSIGGIAWAYDTDSNSVFLQITFPRDDPLWEDNEQRMVYRFNRADDEWIPYTKQLKGFENRIARHGLRYENYTHSTQRQDVGMYGAFYDGDCGSFDIAMNQHVTAHWLMDMGAEPAISTSELPNQPISVLKWFQSDPGGTSIKGAKKYANCDKYYQVYGVQKEVAPGSYRAVFYRNRAEWAAEEEDERAVFTVSYNASTSDDVNIVPKNGSGLYGYVEVRGFLADDLAERGSMIMLQLKLPAEKQEWAKVSDAWRRTGFIDMTKIVHYPEFYPAENNDWGWPEDEADFDKIKP